MLATKNRVPLVVPLWMNGHAYLRTTKSLLDVRHPETQEILRRLPLCGDEEIRLAVDSARSSPASWRRQDGSQRESCLVAWGKALLDYVDHFAALLVEETAWEPARAEDEVWLAARLLNGERCGELGSGGARERVREALDPAGGVPDIMAIVGGVAHPLSGPLQAAVPVLLDGGAVIVCPAPECPSAFFALAELSARCGLPPGCLNILYGMEALAGGLRLVDGLGVCRA